MAGKYWCTSCSCVEMIRDGLFGKKNNHQGNKGTGNENDADEPVDLDNGSAIQYKVHREALKPPKASESGMYKALWSFDARADDEVTFKEGELFKIISRNGDWWTAQKIDKNGIC